VPDIDRPLKKTVTTNEVMPQGYSPELDDFVPSLVDPQGRIKMSRADVPHGSILSWDPETLQSSHGTITAATGTTKVILYIESGSIRFWPHSHTPTPTSGMVFNGPGTIELESPAEIAGFRFIANDGSLPVVYGIQYRDWN
jgi:hypothetical protein